MPTTALGDFLRTRRAHLQPSDVGLAEGLRRRTSGLRREEVAGLAQMSVDYYTRLEQGRGPHPSVAIVASLARALRLNDDERAHLYNLAGHLPPTPARTSTHVSPGLLRILERMADTAAFVVSDVGEVLAQNPLAEALLGSTATRTGRERNVIWRWFAVPGGRAVFPEADWDVLGRTHVADLRATSGRRAGDREVEQLVAALQQASPEFAAMWAEHEVGVRRLQVKRFLHAEVGEIELSCETLTSDVTGQTLVVLYPSPGSPAVDQLELVRVIGLQDLRAATAPGRA